MSPRSRAHEAAGDYALAEPSVLSAADPDLPRKRAAELRRRPGGPWTPPRSDAVDGGRNSGQPYQTGSHTGLKSVVLKFREFLLRSLYFLSCAVFL